MVGFTTFFYDFLVGGGKFIESDVFDVPFFILVYFERFNHNFIIFEFGFYGVSFEV